MTNPHPRHTPAADRPARIDPGHHADAARNLDPPNIRSGDSSPTGPATTARAAAIRAAAIAEAPTHRRLLLSSRHGRILSDTMRLVFAAYTPRGHAVLTTTGRKSGKQRRNYIRAIRRNEHLYVVMIRLPNLAIQRPEYVWGWVWNIRANQHVRVRLGLRVHSGIAREITDPGELDRAREAICNTLHFMDYGEYGVHKRGLPSRAKIKALHRYWFDTGVPLVIELRSGSASL